MICGLIIGFVFHNVAYWTDNNGQAFLPERGLTAFPCKYWFLKCVTNGF